jgi:mxaC protein
MKTPYQAFEAENSEALQQAIQAIEKLENKPIKYLERIPRQSIAEQFFWFAMIGLLLLMVFR